MKILIVVPARGGSKGIPKKNIVPVLGKPLLEYTLDICQQLVFDGDIAVSTDSEEIAEAAGKYSRVTVVKRPEEISQDTSSTEAALLHALEYMKEYSGQEYDCVITMQPTSPLRKLETVQAFLKEFEMVCESYDAQLTLTETYSDYWVKKEDGEFGRLYPEAPRRRQERKPIYIENSCLYITKVEALHETKSVLGKKTNGFVISEKEGVDINTWSDVAWAEHLMKQ